MTNEEFKRIESELQITLPTEYKRLMSLRGKEFVAEGCFSEWSCLFVDVETIITANLMERPIDAGTGHAFPNWWKKFFLVGTNGGGDYYCMRLNASRKLWMIGSDCGDEPSIVSKTIESFVDDIIDKHHKKIQWETNRLKLISEEDSEEMAAAQASDHEYSTKWVLAPRILALTDMLYRVGKTNHRKWRLFAIGCCRQIKDFATHPDCIEAAKIAESIAEGNNMDKQKIRILNKVDKKLEKYYRTDSISREEACILGLAKKLLESDKQLLANYPKYPSQIPLPGDDDIDLLHAHLLRDVIGNPFVPVKFDPQWRTNEVMKIAKDIYKNNDFNSLHKLLEALRKAGCTEPRILKHCERKRNHIRGCWVVDLILQLDIAPEEFSWDFNCTHPTIDPLLLKNYIRTFGNMKVIDEIAALNFADWLEEKGDPVWASIIRILCRIENHPPDEDYTDLWEKYLENLSSLPFLKHIEFEKLFFKSGFSDAWHDSAACGMEYGLPAQVFAVLPGEQQGPVSTLIKLINAVLQNSPVRGIDFQWYYSNETKEILNSPAAQFLRSISFENRNYTEQLGPILESIIESPIVRSINRLSISGGKLNDMDITAMANAPFDNLKKLACASARFSDQFINSTWIKNLEYLKAELDTDSVSKLSLLPRLHTLVLSRTNNFPKVSFQALRRLHLNRIDLVQSSEAFSQCEAPLIELILNECKINPDIFAKIISSPLFTKLKMLSIKSSSFDQECLNILSDHSVAKELRSLKLHVGDKDLSGTFTSLAATTLTKSIFNNLTTLNIEFPFRAGAVHDTALFLSKLTTPKLRHLTLTECGFNDECAEALETMSNYKNLTHLTLINRYGTKCSLSDEALKIMFESPNMMNLKGLKMQSFDGLYDVRELIRLKLLLPNTAVRWY